jgi:hypothetical protein
MEAPAAAPAAPAAAPPLVPPPGQPAGQPISNPDCLIAGKYRMGRKLGGGSFGEIYLGTNVQTGEEVGVKLVRLPGREEGHDQTRLLGRRPSGVGGSSVRPHFTGMAGCKTQESVKARHPQLLYESKLYKILQGGGEALWCCHAGPRSRGCLRPCYHTAPRSRGHSLPPGAPLHRGSFVSKKFSTPRPRGLQHRRPVWPGQRGGEGWSRGREPGSVETPKCQPI